jgi:hypothetical protein
MSYYKVYVTPKVGKWINEYEVFAESADKAIDLVLESVSYDAIFVECDNIAEHL